VVVVVVVVVAAVAAKCQPVGFGPTRSRCIQYAVPENHILESTRSRDIII